MRQILLVVLLALGVFAFLVTGTSVPVASEPAVAFADDDDSDSDDDSSDDPVRVQRARTLVFGPAGDIGGGVLTPGDIFPPMGADRAILKRDGKCLSYRIKTSGLPPGAYTNWWGTWNEPGNCTDQTSFPGSQCGLGDLGNPDLGVFWATGGIVGDDGIGRFKDEYCVGEDRGFPANFAIEPHVAPLQDVQGPGLLNPKGAAVWIIIKYHGPVAADPGARYHQLNSLLGACLEGANAFDFGPGIGVHCFDPQFAFFNP